MNHRGALAIRVKVSDAYRLTGDRDVLLDWIAAIRPATGNLTLDKNGVLSGSLNFSQGRS